MEPPRDFSELLASFDAHRVKALIVEDFVAPDVVVQLGVPPVRIDLLTSISGVTWDEAWDGRVPGEFGGVQVSFLGMAELKRNKRSTGRYKDLADLEALGEEP